MGEQVDGTGRSLSGLDIFSGMPSSILTSIGRKCAWHQLAAHETVVDGKVLKPNAIFFLVEGIVEVVKHGFGDRSEPVAAFKAPECFDDLDLISGRVGPASIRARTDCILAEMDGDRFQTFLAACPCISSDFRGKVISLADIVQMV